MAVQNESSACKTTSRLLLAIANARQNKIKTAANFVQKLKKAIYLNEKMNKVVHHSDYILRIVYTQCFAVVLSNIVIYNYTL